MARVNWNDVRALFPCTRELTYLNTASYGPGPTPVMEAVSRSLADWSAGRGDWQDWDRVGEDARRRFAQLLDIASEQVALLPTMSLAAGQVAWSLPEPGGGRPVIVVGEDEFRSNLFPWLAQERRGFEIRSVPFREGRLDASDVAAAIDEQTAVVALSCVQSATGYRIDLRRVIDACRAHGARLFVDGTQAVGALQMSMDGIDYLAVSGYKWLLAPRGTAYLAVAPEHVGTLQPLAPNWKTPADPYAEYYGPPYRPPAQASRIDQSLAWHSWVGAAAGLQLLHDIGIAAIETRCLALAARFRRGLADIGRSPQFAEAESSHIVGVRIADPVSVKRSLRERGVVAAVRHGYLRVAFALFNDESDVDRALQVLAEQDRG